MKIHIATLKWPYDRQVLAVGTNKKLVSDAAWVKVKEHNRADLLDKGVWQSRSCDMEIITMKDTHE